MKQDTNSEIIRKKIFADEKATARIKIKNILEKNEEQRIKRH